jgi:ATP-dependent DNA helicase RecG
MDSMDFNELFNLLQNADETDRIEAKSAAHGVDKSFRQTVSSFSNEPGLGGGYILLGISRNEDNDEPKYNVTGVPDPDQLQLDIASQCRELFSIPIRPIIKTIFRPQGTILLVYIEEATSHDKPVYIKKQGLDAGTYRRIGSSDQLCTREDLDLLFQLRSKRKYDETLVENASFEDFEPEAIKWYRYERAKVKADATELRYSDEDLLKAVRGIETEKGVALPTIGGLLLFGKQMSLRRLFPLMTQVDYMLVEGREWVTDSDKRYTAFEMAEALVTGIPRLISQIMTDIPQVFALEDDEIRRKDNPIIPRKVIRECVVNALMHKDYRVISPTQIIKYANRTEFRNVGYSLKPQEELGLPGSMTRNPILAQVFRDIHYAEGKGTGIGTMRDEMRKANLSVPLIQSDRSSNQFVLTLLPHHLFDKRDIEWDLSLLDQKGRGNTTFYVPTIRLLAPGTTPETPHTSPLSEGLTPHTSPLSEGSAPPIKPLPEILLSLSDDVIEIVRKIGIRTSPDKVKELIKKLCSSRPFKPSEIALLLKKNHRYVRDYYLTPMVESGELELEFPDNPAHPQQAYRLSSKKIWH